MENASIPGENAAACRGDSSRRKFNSAGRWFGYPEAGGGESVQETFLFGTSFAPGPRPFIWQRRDAVPRRDFSLGRDFTASANSTARVQPPFNTLGGPFDARSVYRRVIDPTLRLNATLRLPVWRHRCPGIAPHADPPRHFNLNDEEPPLATSDGFGYDASVYQNLLAGRTWTIEFTRTF